MADAKVEIKVGAVSFSGEGDGKWLSDQLDKVLDKIPELAKVPQTGDNKQDTGSATGASGGQGAVGSGTLSGFLKAKNATTNQRSKFLATALWLTDVQNMAQMNTGDVTKALTDAKQTPLKNASQCLNDNIKQGFCHKQGKQFYVTDDGRNEVK